MSRRYSTRSAASKQAQGWYVRAGTELRPELAAIPDLNDRMIWLTVLAEFKHPTFFRLPSMRKRVKARNPYANTITWNIVFLQIMEGTNA